mmetsp:Transcript_75490/g.233057  ORF Transcript_75490/g.233057 Transcript_75490/m.233057 type:complete len:224 (-) Transcript_75490:1320-1991(-)
MGVGVPACQVLSPRHLVQLRHARNHRNVPAKVLHHALQLVFDISDVPHDSIDVDTPGLPLQPDAPVKELVNVHVARLVVVDEPEEPLCVVRVETEGGEVSLHALVRQVVLDLAVADRPRAVLVHLLEQPPHLAGILLLQLHLLLYKEVALGPGRLHGVVNEHACDDVHHCQNGEGRIKQEKASSNGVDIHQGIREDSPARATQHRQQQCVDGRRQRAKVPMNL